MDINLDLDSKLYDLKETAADCQALCKIKLGCNFFTWSSSNKRCYLKEGKSGANYELGAISGPKECPYVRYVHSLKIIYFFNLSFCC